MSSADIEVTQAGMDELPALAAVCGRAFVTDPMMYWPLGNHGNLGERFTQCFWYFLERSIPRGTVRQAGASIAAAVWDPPERSDQWGEHPWNQPRISMLADDGGARYRAFWDWVYSHTPREPLWQLDSIAVDPAHQGRGYGDALIADGLDRARASGVGAFLSTGTAHNVTIYGRAGFRVVEEDDYPESGPHVWFMRSDP
jgi:GNAT superfamily N-acetyltransferase